MDVDGQLKDEMQARGDRTQALKRAVGDVVSTRELIKSTWKPVRKMIRIRINFFY